MTVPTDQEFLTATPELRNRYLSTVTAEYQKLGRRLGRMYALVALLMLRERWPTATQVRFDVDRYEEGDAQVTIAEVVDHEGDLLFDLDVDTFHPDLNSFLIETERELEAAVDLGYQFDRARLSADQHALRLNTYALNLRVDSLPL